MKKISGMIIISFVALVNLNAALNKVEEDKAKAAVDSASGVVAEVLAKVGNHINGDFKDAALKGELTAASVAAIEALATDLESLSAVTFNTANGLAGKASLYIKALNKGDAASQARYLGEMKAILTGPVFKKTGL